MRSFSQSHQLAGTGAVLLGLLLAGCGGGGSARSQTAGPVSTMERSPTYHGGPILQHVRVEILYWGPDLAQNSLHRSFNGFFQSLFDDGRYMARLAQYSAAGYRIGNGSLEATTSDGATVPVRVTDAQIQAEISAQIQVGKLPAPGADRLYVVLLPATVILVDPNGIDSRQGFTGYHYYSRAGGFPYAVVRSVDPDEMTITASHELAEAVTDPQSDTWATVAWIDDQYGEIGDIVQNMYAAGQISRDEYVVVLLGANGARYVVQKVWSVRDGAPAGL
jgi:hypothetical protein